MSWDGCQVSSYLYFLHGLHLIPTQSIFCCTSWPLSRTSGRGWPLKNFSKRGVARVTRPLNFWAISANYSNTVKDTDFKFGRMFCGTVYTRPFKIFLKGSVGGQVTPVNFWTLNANSSNMGRLKIQTSNFTNMFPGTVGTCPLKFVKNGRGHGHVTTKFLGVKF